MSVKLESKYEDPSEEDEALLNSLNFTSEDRVALDAGLVKVMETLQHITVQREETVSPERDDPVNAIGDGLMDERIGSLLAVIDRDEDEGRYQEKVLNVLYDLLTTRVDKREMSEEDHFRLLKMPFPDTVVQRMNERFKILSDGLKAVDCSFDLESDGYSPRWIVAEGVAEGDRPGPSSWFLFLDDDEKTEEKESLVTAFGVKRYVTFERGQALAVAEQFPDLVERLVKVIDSDPAFSAFRVQAKMPGTEYAFDERAEDLMIYCYCKLLISQKNNPEIVQQQKFFQERLQALIEQELRAWLTEHEASFSEIRAPFGRARWIQDAMNTVLRYCQKGSYSGVIAYRALFELLSLRKGGQASREKVRRVLLEMFQKAQQEDEDGNQLCKEVEQRARELGFWFFPKRSRR